MHVSPRTGLPTFCTYAATEIVAKCKKGEHATGGGLTGTEEGSGNITSGPRRFAGEGTYSRPDPVKGTPTGWAIEVNGSTSNTGAAQPPAPTATVYAVCTK